MPSLPNDITPFFSAPGGGIMLLGLVLLVVMVVLVWLWMLLDAVRNGFYFWALLILVGAGLGAGLYYLFVYRKAAAKGGRWGIFFRIICFFVGIPFLFLFLPAAWIVYDGSRDNFDHADVALVPGYAETKDETPGPRLTARLDRAAALYAEGKFPFIIVSGQSTYEERDEPEIMARYLEAHHVPASSIIIDHRGEKAGDTIDNLARIMKTQGFHSVLIVTDYYRFTRLKMILQKSHLRELEQAHVGEWKREDAGIVLKELSTTYDRFARTYLLPEVQNLYAQIINAPQKLGDEIKGGKDSVNHGLDSMSK